MYFFSFHCILSNTCLTVDRMNYPPTKRLRGVNQDIPTGTTFDDPFGGDDAFSQDDLAEIDILASQAVTSNSFSGPATKPVETAGGSAGQGRLSSRTSATSNRDSKFGFKSSNNRSKPSRDPFGKFIAWNIMFK